MITKEIEHDNLKKINNFDKLENVCNSILSLIGNVDHEKTAGGFNDAKRYGALLNDIRTILKEAKEKPSVNFSMLLMGYHVCRRQRSAMSNM